MTGVQTCALPILQIHAQAHRSSQWFAPTVAFTVLCGLAWLLNQINTGGMVAAIRQGDMNSLAIDIGLLIMVASGMYTARKIVIKSAARQPAHSEALKCN